MIDVILLTLMLIASCILSYTIGHNHGRTATARLVTAAINDYYLRLKASVVQKDVSEQVAEVLVNRIERRHGGVK